MPSRPALLLLVAAAAMAPVHAAKSAFSASHRAFVAHHNNSALGDWSAEVSAKFLLENKLSQSAVDKLTAAGVDGSVLLELTEEFLVEAGVPAADRLRYHKLVDALQDEHDDEPLHARDLFELRSFSRRNFYSLLNLACVSPASALLYVHRDGRRSTDFDRLFFGADAQEKSPYSLGMALLFPSWVIWCYLREFSDTNPHVVQLLAFFFFGAHLIKALAVLIGAAPQVVRLSGSLTQPLAVRVFIIAFALSLLLVILLYIEAVFAFLWAALYYIVIFPVAPRMVLDGLFFAGLGFWPLLFITFMYGIFKAWLKGAYDASPAAAAVAEPEALVPPNAALEPPAPDAGRPKAE